MNANAITKYTWISYTAVRREHNELADQLVNEALDGASL